MAIQHASVLRSPRGALSRAAGGAAPPWLGVAVVLAAAVLGLTLGTSLFWDQDNLTTVFRGMVIPLLLGVGTTFLLTTGLVDLSIGALLSLGSMALGGLIVSGVPTPLAAALVVVGAGLVSAGLNGTLIVKVGLSFFIVTLGTLSLFNSLAQILYDGHSIGLYDRDIGLLKTLGDGDLGPVPVPVAIALAVTLAGAAMLRWTTLGRAMAAVGGNEAAARLSGVRVQRVRLVVFLVNGLLVGLAAVILTGRLQTASPQAGFGMELQVIAAVLLGGSSFYGGAGTMLGTFLGVLFVGVLQNGMNLLGIPVFWQGLVTGVVLIAAVWIGKERGRRA